MGACLPSEWLCRLWKEAPKAFFHLDNIDNRRGFSGVAGRRILRRQTFFTVCMIRLPRDQARETSIPQLAKLPIH